MIGLENVSGKVPGGQKRNYDRRASEHGLKEGQLVWLFNPARKKHLSPKLQLRWEGPWLIVKRLSDVTVRIQLRRGSKPKVVHVDRLKPYVGEAIQPWGYRSNGEAVESPPLDQVEEPELEVRVDEVSPGANDAAPVMGVDITEEVEGQGSQPESPGETP